MKTVAASLLLVLGLSQGQAVAATQWQALAPGVRFAQLNPDSANPGGTLYAFKVDLTKNHLDLALAQDQNKKSTSVAQLARQSNALIAVNGGFFTPDHQPVGLRIQHGQQRSQIQRTSWWGVFFTKKGKPYIVPRSAFQKNKSINMAVQAGPRLVVNGRIPSLKPNMDERSALCINRKHRVIITVTKNLPLTTTALAAVLRQPESKGGLGCVNALNLDGGHSAQLYAKMGKFYLSVPNVSNITDAIVVLPTSNNR